MRRRNRYERCLFLQTRTYALAKDSLARRGCSLAAVQSHLSVHARRVVCAIGVGNAPVLWVRALPVRRTACCCDTRMAHCTVVCTHGHLLPLFFRWSSNVRV